MMRDPICRQLAAVLLGAMLSLPLHPLTQNEALDQLLSRSGNTVVQLLDRLADVKCNEEVSQEKLTPKGKAEERVQSSYEYLVLLQNHGSEPMIYESREVQKAPHQKKNVSLLISDGFATQLLIFHPYYQASFSFDRLPDVAIGGKTYVQVHFQHIKGRPTPAAMVLRGREYPLSLSGVALIDPTTAVVTHITTELGSSMEDLGLKSFRSEVDYASVGFPKASKTYWLPAQATVEVNTPRQHWKNVHRFTNYQLFSVSVSSEVNLDKLKEKEKDQEQ